MPETTLLCQPISKNQNLNILETKWMSHRLESSIKDVGNYLKLWKTPAPSYLFLNKVLTAWHCNCLTPESQVTVTYCQITFLQLLFLFYYFLLVLQNITELQYLQSYFNGISTWSYSHISPTVQQLSWHLILQSSQPNLH